MVTQKNHAIYQNNKYTSLLKLLRKAAQPCKLFKDFAVEGFADWLCKNINNIYTMLK